MNIIILGGFLGSGKTSVLLQLASYLVDKEKDYESETKVAIVENEIGKISIDDRILQDAGYNVKNLFSGCACCSLRGDLITFIDDIQKSLNPKWLIVEATGVAYPGNIRDVVLKYRDIDSYILTIVDSQRWNKIKVGLAKLLIGQLKDSMTILINKTDLIDAEELERVKEDVLSYNEELGILPISAIKEIPEEIFINILNDMEVRGFEI